MRRPAVRTVEHFDTEDSVDVMTGESADGGATVTLGATELRMTVADMEAAIQFFRRLIAAAAVEPAKAGAA